MLDYLCDLSYRHSGQNYDSGFMGGGNTLLRARVDLGYHIHYYQEIGCIITEAVIIERCAACSGTGEKFIPSKRNKFLGKRIRCPECKGKNSERVLETWIERATERHD